MHLNTQKGLFENYRQCGICGKRLPDTYKEDYCPNCLNLKLLHDVKDFIRENEVNEYQVAEQFDIPVKMVKEWIREGHIEYKQNKENETIAGIHCRRCGAPVTFGTLCPKCLKLLNGNSIKGYSQTNHSNSEKMRFLDQND